MKYDFTSILDRRGKDAVAVDAKPGARQTVAAALTEPGWDDVGLLGVRVNDWTTPWTYLDVMEVIDQVLAAGGRIDVVVLPKVAEVSHIHALDLLLLALHPDESAFDGDEITDPDALLTPLKAQYGAFFAQPTRLPTDVVSPPVTAAPPLTKEDVRRMSQEDINRNWSSVCSVLSKGD